MSAERSGASHNRASALAAARQRMLELLRRHVSDTRVIDAMAAVPRERFVPAYLEQLAYEDRALPIGEGQTISQPLIVALMLEALEPRPEDRALEVGSGSGYAAAVLSRLVKTVDAFERESALVERSRETLRSIGADNIRVFQAGDVLGSNEREAYDAVLVSAGAPHVPRTLLDQLRQGGRLVIPIGSMRSQDLVRATKTSHGTELSRLGPCAFVPLIGGEAWPEQTGDDDVSRRPILR